MHRPLLSSNYISFIPSARQKRRVSSLLARLPTTAGVYLMRNHQGKVLYVGKAKNLRARLRTYFAPHSFIPPQPHPELDPTKHKLVTKLRRLDYIITNTETEALLLESNLISRWKPPYNVILQGDRGILYIALTKETYPRLIITRRPNFRYTRCFGPYPSAKRVRQLMRTLRKLFPLRTCALKLVQPQKQPCLLFELGRCLAPCIRACSPKEYGKITEKLIRFLQGDYGQVQQYLAARMKKAAQAYQFELAAHWRDLMTATNNLFAQQKIISARPLDEDIFALSQKNGISAVCAMEIRKGRLCEVKTFRLRHQPRLEAGPILDQFLCQYYAAAATIPSRIILSHALPPVSLARQWLNERVCGKKLHIDKPQRGKSLLLLKLGHRNAQRALAEAQASQALLPYKQALPTIAKITNLPAHSVKRIEAYDVSTLTGNSATGAMVVFVNGRPARKQYRRFRIRQFSRPHDTGMLSEILTRRFHNHHWSKRNGWARPDFILVDGGRAQCLAAARVLQKLHLKIPVLALAKKEEEIYLPSRARPLRLARTSAALKLLQYLRDEAHRFSLRYHHNLRRRTLTSSLLQTVPGIGSATCRKLLSRFSSLEELRKASFAQLASLIGARRARVLRAAFRRSLLPKITSSPR
jgi:excinuclease ABC subunit C